MSEGLEGFEVCLCLDSSLAVNHDQNLGFLPSKTEGNTLELKEIGKSIFYKHTNFSIDIQMM